MTRIKESLSPIALTPQLKQHRLLNHLVRLSLRMHERGWIGSECLTFKMENDKRLRIEYSINPLMYHKRVVVFAEREKMRVVNTSATSFKPIGALIDILQWNIKEIQTNANTLGYIPQSLKTQMRWEEFEYEKDVSATRDGWLKKLKAGSSLFYLDASTTHEWLSHLQSILEFKHPLNKTVHSVVSNLLPNADSILLHNTKMRHYTENSNFAPSLCDTIDTIVPIMLDQKRTWPSIRLHKDRDGAQHFIFSKSDSVVPMLHVKKSADSEVYTLLESACKNLDGTQGIHEQLLSEIRKPSIPLDHAWWEQLKLLSDFKLLEPPDKTTRPDQLWIRCVKNYAEQIHVEMVRNDNLYEAWSQHIINNGDANVVTTVLAAMTLARSDKYVLAASVDKTPADDLYNPAVQAIVL